MMNDEQEYEDDIKPHYFWVEADIQVRQEGKITVKPDLSRNGVEKYAKDQVAKALMQMPTAPKLPK